MDEKQPVDNEPYLLRIKVTPRASSNAVIGWLDKQREVLVLKVTAPAEGGKANAAVIKLLAEELNIPKSAIHIKRGSTSRHKLVSLEAPQDAISAWLDRRQGGAGDKEAGVF